MDSKKNQHNVVGKLNYNRYRNNYFGGSRHFRHRAFRYCRKNIGCA